MELAGRGLLQFLLILIIGIAAVKSFDLTLLHTNDVHSHFVEFNAFGGRCADKLKEDKKCFGGFARQVTKVKEIRSSKGNVLFLNGGDFYQGTVWYTLHRWQIVAELVNKLTIDVMSLGNHEFDDGIKGLLPFLQNLKTKVVVCNINSSKVPEFAEYVHPSTIVEVGGERIGIIGYLTPETKFLSSAGDLEFEDEVECIKREAKRLVSEEGLNKIMAVGHSGFAVDQDIAREVPEVDIVVGGHTNTFLYTGDPPSVEEPQGPYPFLVTREDGSQALVVQDFAFGKYMGFLEVQFDDKGKVTKWSGNPILLDASVEEDPETLELLEPYAQEVKRRVRQTVGKTNVLLRGDRLTCRMRECNLGNFLADASLDFFIEQPTEKGWNFVAIALWNSGGIRASIDERINGGNITLEDVLAVAPFGNTMDVVALKGKHLREVLEHSVKDYDLYAVDPPGSLLQVSGLRLTYNMSQPVGSRLVEIYARCADCRVPQFLPLEDEKVYEVVMNTYMAKGGDGFDVIEKNAISNRNTDLIGFRPSPPEANNDSTLIWFDASRSETTDYWVNNLKEYLKPYQDLSTGGNAIHCTNDYPATHDKVCYIPILRGESEICSEERKFGYPEGKPCVLIKFNRIYGWEPQRYSRTPAELQKHLNEDFDPSKVYVTCVGENPADRDNIGEVKYYPHQGIKAYYFPFTNQRGYVSPFVFVQFDNITRGALVNVECRAWAANINFDRGDRLGSVHFELLID